MLRNSGWLSSFEKCSGTIGVEQAGDGNPLGSRTKSHLGVGRKGKKPFG